jgi:ATP-dependent Zn protease
MHSFEEVEFVEEEYLRNKEVIYRKVTGRLKGELYYCEVMSFDEIMHCVMEDGNIPYKNVRRSGILATLSNVYNFLDAILILFILVTIIRAPSGGAGMGAPQMNQVKKFDIAKNVNIKFADVAGLHESKR